MKPHKKNFPKLWEGQLCKIRTPLDPTNGKCNKKAYIPYVRVALKNMIFHPDYNLRIGFVKLKSLQNKFSDTDLFYREQQNRKSVPVFLEKIENNYFQI